MTESILVTYADLGTLKNQKTKEALVALEALSTAIPPTSIICRDQHKFTTVPTKIALPLGRLIPASLQLISNILPINGRIIAEKFFDFAAARKLPQAPRIMLNLCLISTACTKKIKQYGGCSIGYLSMANPQFVSEKILGVTHELTQQDESARQADYLIAMSEYAKKTYVEYGISSKKIYVVPLGIDSDIFKPAKKNDEIFRIVTVADFTKLKGLEYLLEAYKQLNLPNAELIVVGTIYPETISILKKYANMPGLQYVGHANPLHYYQQASIVVFPTLTEGFGKVILEAMACAKPVITTTNTGIVVSQGKDGFVVPIRDAKAIAKNIKYLYNHPKSLTTMSSAARTTILKNYTTAHFCERLTKTLSKIYSDSKK